MLGYGVAVPEWGSVYGPAEATDVFEITEVSCKGDEQNLLDCSLKSKPKTPALRTTLNLLFRVSRGCSRGKVAGVTCFYEGDDQCLQNMESMSIGFKQKLPVFNPA